MLTVYLMPTEEELFKKYNPDLQKRSLEGREERLQEFNTWLTNLKRQSKINKPSTCHAYISADFGYPPSAPANAALLQSGSSKKRKPVLPARLRSARLCAWPTRPRPSARPCAKKPAYPPGQTHET